MGIQDLGLYVCVFPLRSQLQPCSKGTLWYLSIVVPGIYKNPKVKPQMDGFSLLMVKKIFTDGKENPQENVTYIKIVRFIQFEH